MVVKARRSNGHHREGRFRLNSWIADPGRRHWAQIGLGSLRRLLDHNGHEPDLRVTGELSPRHSPCPGELAEMIFEMCHSTQVQTSSAKAIVFSNYPPEVCAVEASLTLVCNFRRLFQNLVLGRSHALAGTAGDRIGFAPGRFFVLVSVIVWMAHC